MNTKKFLAIALAVLLTVLLIPLTAFAEEVVTEPVTAPVMEFDTSEGILIEIETEEETEEKQKVDEWIYEVMKQATPEQVKLIEEIVLGGLNALDKLEIKGFDRVRIWVEHNMATVMVVALTVALIAFAVVSFLQKKGFAKKADILNSNAIEMYEAGQQNVEEALAACKEYADRADEICRECADAAKAAAESAKAAHGQVTEERTMLIDELEKNARVNKALCEEINFLLQCSDLSQSKRDEAEAIFRQGMEVIDHDGESET